MRALSWPPGITVISREALRRALRRQKSFRDGQRVHRIRHSMRYGRGRSQFFRENRKVFRSRRDRRHCVSQIVFVLFFCILDARRNGPRNRATPPCAVTSSENERQPIDSAERFRLHLGHSGFDAELPRRWFTQKLFVNGGAPKNIPTGLFRSCAPRAPLPGTEKSGTKRHANGT